MFAHSGHVMTLANSIIGVGILAMPFCFQKCGIILAILLLIISNWITRICCHYLIKCSLLTRRKSFEFLGFHAFGSSGKFLVELCIIGYLLGTCVTYFVVVGDLGPQIVTKMLSLDSPHVHLRTLIMVAVTVVCILPLGMLKNVDSLSTVCTASIGFYVCLVLKIVLESEEHIMSNDWTEQVKYWEPSGVLQCLPIFSMALSCQMQLFEVFESINNQSLEKLNGIVKNATWICTCVYVAVGFFGYVAFCKQSFSGNILINLSESFGSDVIKIGFVLSVAFSFPLVIFPCRASIYSLLYRKGHTDTTYIPENRFKAITIFIVCLALFFALMIPSVELIIGLVGSTIGVAICIMFPASCYRKIVKKESTERTLAQFILISGFCLMILGTYANLNAIDAKNSGAHLEVQASINEVFARSTTLAVKKVDPLIKEFEINNLSQADEKIFKLPEREEKLVKPSNEIKKEKPEIPQKPKALEKLPPSPPPLPIDEKHEQILKPEPSPLPVVHPQKPERVEVVPLKANRTLSSGTVENQTNFKVLTTTQGINKDAISKDEDIAAEELKNDKKGEQAENEELKKTQNELKKTKELLKNAVGELKEELAKQNQQAQNLVAEKLSAVVEKVEKIEREVQQKKEEQTKNKEATTVENNNVKIKEAKPEAMRRNKGSLISMLADENTHENPSKDAHANKEKVYEPLSYKTGELIENVRNATKLDQRLPLPLQLLINASSTNVKADKETLNTQKITVEQLKKESEKSLKEVPEHFSKEPGEKARNDQQPGIDLDEKNVINKKTILKTGVKTENKDNLVMQVNKENEEDKQNVEAIRRDLLQLKPMQHEDSTTTIKVTDQLQKRARIKRSSHLDTNHSSFNDKTAELEKQNCQSAVNVEKLLDMGTKSGSYAGSSKPLSNRKTTNGIKE